MYGARVIFTSYILCDKELWHDSCPPKNETDNNIIGLGSVKRPLGYPRNPQTLLLAGMFPAFKHGELTWTTLKAA